MTIEGPDGHRYLVYRDGTPVLPLPEGEVLNIKDLDPASADIVRALIAARENAEKRRLRDAAARARVLGRRRVDASA